MWLCPKSFVTRDQVLVFTNDVSSGAEVTLEVSSLCAAKISGVGENKQS